MNWEKGYRDPEIRLWPKIVEFLGDDPSPTPRTTAEKLKAIRRQRGWSQRHLAADLGVDGSTVQHWEAGKEPHRLRSRRLLAELFGSARSS